MALTNVIDWLEAHSLTCSFKSIAGVECPSCGTQRALILLIKGEFLNSLKMYPALIPTVFLFVFLILHIIFKFKNGAEILKHTFIFVITVMIFNYLLKLVI